MSIWGNQLHKLKDSTVYLAGPIQYIEDSGIEWRDKAIMGLKSLNVNVFNPINKPYPYLSEIKEESQQIQDFISTGDFEGGHAFVKEKVVHIDLRMVDLSDFLIVYINPEVHTCGTYHELFHAWEQKKPVLTFIEGGRKNVPAWLLGIIKPKYIFDNLNRLIVYLRRLNAGIESMDSKWVLLNAQIN